jgi:hypothetical protein
MLVYVPFLDPRHPETVKFIRVSGNKVRIEYRANPRVRGTKCTILAKDYKAYLECVAALAEQPKNSEIPTATKRVAKPKLKVEEEIIHVDIPARAESEGVSG